MVSPTHQHTNVIRKKREKKKHVVSEQVAVPQRAVLCCAVCVLALRVEARRLNCVVGLTASGCERVQAYDAKYIPDTCNMLLKWKPSSHNSVDFTLLPDSHPAVQADCAAALAAGQRLFLGVWAEARVVVAFDVDHDRLAALGPEESLKKALTAKPARVTFPGGEDPEEFHGMVIECNFDGEEHVWCFMRDRAKCVALEHPACVASVCAAVGVRAAGAGCACSGVVLSVCSGAAVRWREPRRAWRQCLDADCIAVARLQTPCMLCLTRGREQSERGHVLIDGTHACFMQMCHRGCHDCGHAVICVCRKLLWRLCRP